MNERFEVHVAHRSERSAARHRILARAASLRDDLIDWQTCRDTLFRDLVTLHRCERIGTVVVGGRVAVLEISPHSHTELYEMRSTLIRGIVLIFVVLVAIVVERQRR